jgi:hypothetical protein
LVALIIYVGRHGGVLTGANGVDAFDQMAYLAWIRDEGGHLLSSNLWVLGHTPHDYIHPMYVVSGLLWRLGFGVQLAYLIWKPVALLVMFFGFAAYVRHGSRTAGFSRPPHSSSRSSMRAPCWPSRAGPGTCPSSIGLT